MATLSSSDSDSIPGSPISRIPYDVLAEIFVHCPPQHRLREQQPNTTIAPMLLCQICSVWRTVALNLGILWSHLPFCLTIGQSVDDYYDYGILSDQSAFLSWWRRNQGLTPSYLSITIRWHKAEIFEHRGLNDAETLSLYKYIAAARFLEIDGFIWRLLYEWSDDGDPEVYPTPHTCMKSGFSKHDFFYRVQALIPNDAPSALRYLSISDDMLPRDFIITHHWSTLTHLALEDVKISLNVWFSLIRACPDLQWGYFYIFLPDGGSIQPASCTLPHLSTISITLQDVIRSEFEFPLSTLFTNLHLPTLRTLSLSSCERSWRNHRAITELHTVLHSTPAIRTLFLDNFFLSLDNYPTAVLPMIRDIQPIWCHATQLVHFKYRPFSLVCGRGMEAAVVEKSLSTVLQNIFLPDDRFLDLTNPACPIRKITLIANGPSDSHFRSDNIGNFTMAKVQEYLQAAPNVNVVFEFVLDLEYDAAVGERNEWDSIP